MEAKIETVIERLLSGYRRYYNVTRFDGGYNPPPEEFKGICEAEKLTPPVLPGDVCFNALCEYYEKAEGRAVFSFSTQRTVGNPSGRVYLFVFRSGTDAAGF